jgi:Spy/CpxP family protein refolding chaperone
MAELCYLNSATRIQLAWRPAVNHLPAQAEGLGSGHAALQHRPKAGGMHPAKHSGGCPMHGRKHGEARAGGYGKVHRARHGEGHARPLFGKGWTETLSAEQKAALDKLHVDYAKNKVQQRSKIKALKVQLTVLATADESQPEAAATKIDALLATKREMLLAKQAYIAEQRAVLTPEQRVSFDMTMIHQALPSGECGHGRRQ